MAANTQQRRMRPRWVAHLGVLLVALAGSAFAPSRVCAGPWTHSWGQGYVKLWQGGYHAANAVNAEGSVRRDVAFTSLMSMAYAEVGIWEQMQVIATVPFYVWAQNSSGLGEYRNAGPGDLGLGLQWTSPWLSIPHAVRVEVKVPMYDFATLPLHDRTRYPIYGDGQLDSTLWLSIGRSFLSDVGGYAYGEFGYRFRTTTYIGEALDRQLGDQLVFRGEAGTRILGVTVSLNVAGAVAHDGASPSFVNTGVAAYCPIGGAIAIEANFDYGVWARAAGRGFAGGVGLSYAFGKDDS